VANAGLANGAKAGTSGYTSGTQYTYTMTLTRNGSGGLDISSIMSGAGLSNGTISVSTSDSSPNSFTYDSFALRPSDSNTTASAFDTSLFEVDFITTVPEPSTWALVGSGIALMLGAVRRRRRS